MKRTGKPKIKIAHLNDAKGTLFFSDVVHLLKNQSLILILFIKNCQIVIEKRWETG